MHTIDPKGEQSNLHLSIIKMVNLPGTNIHVTKLRMHMGDGT
jgi:hypothetical protein